jgi:hypothetical protein
MLPLTRSRNRARFFGIPFSPATLFVGGTVAGAWYDPSDLSTMFTTSAGTTPVAMPGGGAAVSVGRMLDKSGNGNHAISFNDTTARPELRARVNLLERSEEFDNAYWTKADASIVVNSTTAPDGTTTAETFGATAAAGYVYSTFTAAATAYTMSVYAKANTTNQIRLDFVTAGFGNGGTCVFTLTGSGSAGSVIQFGGSTGYVASITSVGNGWYRCSLTGTATAATWFYELTTLGSGQSVFIWGADLRPANIGANVPAYQRIADANTYDTSGFPLYLRFDGIDDSMYTPANLNLSGTDKVAVFAGVRRLSNASATIISEFSANVATNSGSFWFVSGDATYQYSALSRGTSGVGATIDAKITALSFAPPSSAVIANTHDIAGDLTSIRGNGVLQNSATGDQGAGNFGNYPLYIGARNNASSWLNGHLHSLIIAGSAVSAGNISATEQWVAGKTGIQI